MPSPKSLCFKVTTYGIVRSWTDWAKRHKDLELFYVKIKDDTIFYFLKFNKEKSVANMITLLNNATYDEPPAEFDVDVMDTNIFLKEASTGPYLCYSRETDSWSRGNPKEPPKEPLLEDKVFECNFKVLNMKSIDTTNRCPRVSPTVEAHGTVFDLRTFDIEFPISKQLSEIPGYLTPIVEGISLAKGEFSVLFNSMHRGESNDGYLSFELDDDLYIYGKANSGEYMQRLCSPGIRGVIHDTFNTAETIKYKVYNWADFSRLASVSILQEKDQENIVTLHCINMFQVEPNGSNYGKEILGRQSYPQFIS